MRFLAFCEAMPDRLYLFGDTAPLYWRELCHLVGSLVIIAFLYMAAHVLRQEIIVGTVSVITLYFLFQEIFLHRKRQKPLKTALDLTFWLLPLYIFLYLLYYQ